MTSVRISLVKSICLLAISIFLLTLMVLYFGNEAKQGIAYEMTNIQKNAKMLSFAKNTQIYANKHFTNTTQYYEIKK